MEAIYINDTAFKIEGNKIPDFSINRRLKIDCGADGIKYAKIASSYIEGEYTVVTILDGYITSNIIDVLYSVIDAGAQGNLPDHYHSASEGDGGHIQESIPYFNSLLDTPTTYSGTEGFFAKSTGSGIEFEEVQVDKSFLELTDTETTYSGTEGYFAKSTGSGIVFEEPSVYTFDSTPDYLTESNLDDIAIDISENTIIQKNRENVLVTPAHTIKSVIIDVNTNWGANGYIGIRSVDFWHSGSKITRTQSDFLAYHESARAGAEAKWAFDTSVSKIGAWYSNVGWFTGGTSANRRIICVFNTPVTFDKIVINNYHDSGTFGDRGARASKITVSTDTITDVTYNAAVSNSAVIFNGEFNRHIASNVIDDHVLDIILPPPVIPESGWDTVLSTTKNFTELLDSPATYSGTEGYFAKSTGSGIVWEEVQVDKSFLDLTDTETTYSGTEGFFAKSTGSGIEWAEVQASAAQGSQSFLDLTDTVTTYSGTEGFFAKSTGSGIDFQNSLDHKDLENLQGGTTDEHYHLTSDQLTALTTGQDTDIHTHSVESSSFLDLTDTPTTYSGVENKYLQTTISGIVAADGIIIMSPNNSKWLVRVTDQGTLYTEEI